LIDLHTHTTASDGRCTPSQLVARAAAAGVDVLSVTDHDTVAACAAVRAESAAAGIQFVPGIEITAVADGIDVHVLGYFIDIESNALRVFLSEQRRRRVDRVRQIVARLATLGIQLDADAIVRPAVEHETKSAGRPWIARALIEAGHVATVGEAFDRWLARGRPAYIPRLAASPAEVVERIHEAGGIASLAHPGLLDRDALIPPLVRSGLDALETYHSKHDQPTTLRYIALADQLGVAMSGGSDYHADEARPAITPGCASLPRDQYEQLVERRSRV
jgi:predicted metal-dependent phosphoesterase TrpH